MTPEEREQQLQASREAAAAASRLLDSELESILMIAARLEEFKPRNTDEETYKKLAAVIEEATVKNESIATLKHNIERLGVSAVSLCKTIAAIA